MLGLFSLWNLRMSFWTLEKLVFVNTYFFLFLCPVHACHFSFVYWAQSRPVSVLCILPIYLFKECQNSRARYWKGCQSNFCCQRRGIDLAHIDFVLIDGRRENTKQHENTEGLFVARWPNNSITSADDGKPCILSSETTKFTRSTTPSGNTCSKATGKGKKPFCYQWHPKESGDVSS